jgi:DNA polymerase-4
LFENEAAREKLNTAIDRINARYGKNAIYFGGAHQALNAAPMRIAFTHIPDVALEGDE